MVDGSVATISIKNFPIGLHVMYLYSPDTPRILLTCRLNSTNVSYIIIIIIIINYDNLTLKLSIF